MPGHDGIITRGQMHRQTLAQRQGPDRPHQGGSVDKALLGAHLGRGPRWRTGLLETIGFSNRLLKNLPLGHKKGILTYFPKIARQ